MGDMPPMDKETQDAVTKGITFLWAFGIAAGAGIVNFLQRFTGETPPSWSWLVFFIKGFTAGSVGIVTNWLLAAWHLDGNYVNFAIALAGWGGAETIVFFQQVFQDGIRRASSAPKNGNDPGARN